MKRKMLNVCLKRTVLCLLALCLLCGGLLLASCKREVDEEKDGNAITVQNAHTLRFRLQLEDAVYQKYKKQTVLLYEYAPNEGAGEAVGKAPVASAKLTSSTVEIELPLLKENGARDRLYATYLLATADGTLLTEEPMCVSGAQRLAALCGDFPNLNNIKGLASADAELSRALYAAHTLTEVRASALVSEKGELHADLFGSSLALDSGVIASLDAQIFSATRAGLQVSLSLIPDAELPMASYAALLEFLASRYSSEAGGLVTAILIGQAEERTAATAEAADPARDAELLRLAALALTSRVANGRVYLTVGGEVAAIESHLLAVSGRSKRMGISFGIALAPDCVTQSLLGEEPSARLILSALPDAVQSFKKQLGGAPVAVVGLRFSASDPDLQAALYTYAYHLSLNIKADFMIYSALANDAVGLYTADLKPRAAAHAFRLADSGENLEGEGLASLLLAQEWSVLHRSVRPARVFVEGIANVGTTEDTGKRWFDFSGAEYPAFATVGNGTSPQTVHSASFSSQVLVASLGFSDNGIGAGYRATVSAEALEKAYILSARILGQAPAALEAPLARITLLLDGTTIDGRALSYSSTITVPANQWQTVSFLVRDYTQELDPALPCTLTLLMQPCGEDGAPVKAATDANAHYSLWLHSVNLRRVKTDASAALVLGVAVAGFALGLVAVALLSRVKRGGAEKKSSPVGEKSKKEKSQRNKKAKKKAPKGKKAEKGGA